MNSGSNALALPFKYQWPAGKSIESDPNGISRRSLDDLSANDVVRGKWMTEAYKEHGYTMAEIANYAGVHYSLVSNIIKNWRGDDSRFKT